MREIWINIERLMYEFNDQHITFNEKNVMMNSLIEDKKNVKNFICLLTKQYIYRQRCFKKEPNYNELKTMIYQMRNTEKFIAIKNDKIKKHYLKWGKDN